MSDVIWPETMLPLPLHTQQLSTDGRIIRTEMESGYARQRMRFDAVGDKYNVTWMFNEVQMALFRSFFKYKLKNGSLYFTMGLAAGDWGVTEALQLRIMGGAYSVNKLDGNGFWSVQATLEVQDSQPMSEDAYSFIEELFEAGMTPDQVFEMRDELHELVHETLPEEILPA